MNRLVRWWRNLTSPLVVRVHTAVFVHDETKQPHYFVNVANHGGRTVVLAHVGHQDTLCAIVGRPLPVPLAPCAAIEYAFPVGSLGEGAEREFFATLADGSCAYSFARKNVPPSGVVPDGR